MTLAAIPAAQLTAPLSPVWGQARTWLWPLISRVGLTQNWAMFASSSERWHQISWSRYEISLADGNVIRADIPRVRDHRFFGALLHYRFRKYYEVAESGEYYARPLTDLACRYFARVNTLGVAAEQRILSVRIYSAILHTPMTGEISRPEREHLVRSCAGVSQ